MTNFYDGVTRGFYSSDIHGDNIPDGAVEITEKQLTDLLNGQSAGQEIVPDGQGVPVLQDRLPPIITDLDEIAAIERTITSRRIRDAILTPGGKAWLQAEENKIEAIRNKT